MQEIAAPFIAILIAFAAYGLGLPIVGRFDKPHTLTWTERILISSLIGSMIMAGLVWIIGHFRYDISTMAILLTILVIFAALSTRRSTEPTVDFRNLIPKGAWCLIPIAIVVILIIGIVGSYAPPSNHDTIRYHLYLPERDLQWGRIGANFGWSIYEFLPPLSAMLTHLAYALGGAVGAQLLNILWQIAAAGIAAALTFRLSQRADIAWLAALFLLGQRVSINLASSVSVEFVLASYAGIAVLGALALLRRPDISMGILLGLMVGGLINVKHHGPVYAACLYLPLLILSIRRKEIRYPVILSGIIALALLTPWLTRNWVVAGNPFFPAFHHLFGEDNINLFKQILINNQTPKEFLFLALLPWNIFVDQIRFDGLQFGIPFLLIFMPFAFVAKYRQPFLLLVGIIAAYLIIWFLVMPHLIRFLIPLFPILCTLAALGAGVVSDASRNAAWKRRTVFIIAIGLGLTQAGFLMATGIRRVPAALNITSPDKFLESKPFKILGADPDNYLI